MAPLRLRFSTSPFLTCARLADGDKAIWRQADVPNPALLGAHPPFPSPTRLLITLAFARGSQGPQQDFGEVCLQPLVTNTVSAFPSRKFCWQGSWLPGSCLIPALGSGGGRGARLSCGAPGGALPPALSPGLPRVHGACAWRTCTHPRGTPCSPRPSPHVAPHPWTLRVLSQRSCLHPQRQQPCVQTGGQDLVIPKPRPLWAVLNHREGCTGVASGFLC